MAARNSAASLFDGNSHVQSWALDVGPTADPLAPKLSLAARWTRVIVMHAQAYRKFASPGVDAAMEDVPLHPAHVASAYLALRIQGVMLYVLHSMSVPVELIQAKTWQLGLGYSTKEAKANKMTSKGWAANKCAELGLLVPPEFKGKAVEDVRDTLLIGTYALSRGVG